MKKIAILTKKNDWFYKYAIQLSNLLNKKGYLSRIFTDHKKIKGKYDVVFILSYYRLVDEQFLKKNKHNVVIHESNLPKGKGWAPLFWQILGGKNIIDFTVFEADKSVDGGDYYFKDKLKLSGTELYDEIRVLQAQMRIKCCFKLLRHIKKIKF